MWLLHSCYTADSARFSLEDLELLPLTRVIRRENLDAPIAGASRMRTRSEEPNELDTSWLVFWGSSFTIRRVEDEVRSGPDCQGSFDGWNEGRATSANDR